MTHINWRIHVLNHGPRLLSNARATMADANEAHLLVHTVIARALGKERDGALRTMDDHLGSLIDDRIRQPA